LESYQISDTIKTGVFNELKERAIFDDKRYVNAYISGKHRIKKWGRNKIKAGLRLKKIEDEMIQFGLQNFIDDEEYLTQLERLFERKWLSLKKKEDFSTRQKIYRYLYTKGYENELITKIVNKAFSN
jgi:regulatory protein